jgi:hypothetical protein
MLKVDPRTPALIITQGDTAKPFKATLFDCNNQPIDLSAATVSMTRKLAGSNTLVTLPCTVDLIEIGTVLVEWPTGSNDVPGEYHFQLVVTQNGRTETHPKGSSFNYELMRILPRLA